MALSTLFFVLAAGAAPAHATGYRYWSFWVSGDGSGDGSGGGAKGNSWAYATEGPATARPSDGEVNGFRFAVSADSADATKPRTAPDFATLCAATPAKPGTKRVGIVIDFGTPEHSPEGETPPAPDRRNACARVDASATSAEALASVAKPLRYDSAALLCGISGYPKSGCGDQVAADSAPASRAPQAAKPDGARDGEGGPSLGVIGGVAAVLALGTAAFWQARRRRG
ncbi:transmembrane domain-containing protein [Streptomyces sp. NPDC019396]|uniref:transmembrane domain-containing protein n=1 Tax=Streptomyces sp. NPDC019396 TaxID=3154687 RepID=UPI0033E0AFB8